MRLVEVELARVEARRLAGNPLVWLSLLACGWWLRRATTTDSSEDAYNLLSGFSLILPGSVCCVLVAFAVLRSRRAGSDELLGTAPVGPDRCTLAHGASLLAPAGIAAGWMAVQFAVLGRGRVVGRTHDTIPANVEIPRPNLAQVLQGPLAVVTVCALVIAVARWVPTWITMLVFIMGALLQLTVLGPWSATPTSVVNWLTPLSHGWVNGVWRGCTDGESVCDLYLEGFDRTTPWWHLVYLAALAALFTVVALLRHRRDRVAWVLLGISTAAVAATVVIQALVFERFDAVAP